MNLRVYRITHKFVGANYDLVKGKNTGLIASDISEFGEQMLRYYMIITIC